MYSMIRTMPIYETEPEVIKNFKKLIAEKYGYNSFIQKNSVWKYKRKAQQQANSNNQ